MPEETVQNGGVIVGPPKVEAGCPPRDIIFVPEGTETSAISDEICVANLVNALSDIEAWIADIRKVLECLPPDLCIECPTRHPGKLVARPHDQKRNRAASRSKTASTRASAKSKASTKRR